MIHRTRRHTPTLPARRGMRAGWFRGRFSGETDDPAAPERDLVAGEEPPEPAGPVDPDDGDPSAPASPDTPSTPASLVRPGFGHPTF